MSAQNQFLLFKAQLFMDFGGKKKWI